VIDNATPVINVLNFPAGPFTNQDNITVDIAPMTSGIKSVTYKYSYESTVRNGTVSSRKTIIPLAEHNTYALQMTVTNNANTAQTFSLGTVAVDRTLPVITNSSMALNSSTSQYYSKDRTVPVTINMNDAYAGIHQFVYTYAENLAEIKYERKTIETGNIAGVTSNILQQKELAMELNDYALLEGKKYYLIIWAKDWAGNFSVPKISDKPIMIDTIKPDVQVDITGLISDNSQYYLASVNNITAVNPVIVETGSGVKQIQYAITEQGIDDAVYRADWSAAKLNPPQFADGKRYVVATRTEDYAGHITIENSVPFVFDSSAPPVVTLSEWTTGIKLVSEEVHFKTTTTDLHSPIVKYKMAIGTVLNSTFVSSHITGNQDGWLENTDGMWNITIPPVASAVYRITVQAVNASGLISVNEYYNITVNEEADRVIIHNPGSYQTTANSYQAELQYAGHGTLISYEYRLTGQGINSGSWTTSAAPLVNITGLQLVNGQEYRLEARAVIAETGATVTTISNPTKVDTTYPVFDALGGLTVPVAFSKNKLIIGWKASDPESNIKQVQLLLEKYDAQHNRQSVGSGWIGLTAVGTATQTILIDADGKPLVFENGDRIYITLRIVNGAGLAVERITAPAVYDNTAPPKPEVTDQGVGINLAQAHALEADWFWTSDDPESGNSAYQWAITKTNPKLPGALDGLQWYPDNGTHKGKLSDITINGYNPVHGDTWYFVVKTTNNAGLSSIGYSDGITLDATGAIITEVKLLQGQTIEEQHYINTRDNLYLHIGAYDPETPISRYEARYGTFNSEGVFQAANDVYANNTTPVSLKRPEGSNVDKLPQITEGTRIRFEGAAVNGAVIKEHGYTSGVILDTTKPEVVFVNAQCTNGIMLFDWNTTILGASPIVKYAIELWRPDVSALVYTNDTCTVNNLIIDTVAAGMIDGLYELSVTAYNGAGSASAQMLSNSIMLDRTPPTATVQVQESQNKAYVWNYLGFEITGTDNLAGISEYEYSLGTVNDPIALSKNWQRFATEAGLYSTGIDFESALPGGEDSVIDGSILYLYVRVKDKGNLWSSVVRSQPIYVDKTAPDKPIVTTVKKYYNSENLLDGINITLQDLQSGVLGYVVGISNTPNGVYDDMLDIDITDLGTTELRVDISDYILSGVRLQHNDQIYIAVYAVNGTGQMSQIGYSEKIVIDLQAPVLIFQGTYPESGASGNDELVFNHGPFVVRYAVSDNTAGSVSEVKFTLTGKDAALNSLNREMGPFAPVKLVNGTYDFRYSYDETAYGMYYLWAEVTDTAGNKYTSLVQNLRVNQPPVITFDGDFTTTPGKPFTLRALVDDPDNGSRGFTYLWQVVESANVLGVFDAAAAEPVIKLKHRNAQVDQESIYLLNLTVTDSDGKRSMVTSNDIKVVRTQEGELSADEWWSGAHMLVNTVTVPIGRKLYLANGMELSFKTNYEGARGYKLDVFGELRAGAGSVFKMADGFPGEWDGIYAHGIVNVTGCRIEGAMRGVVVYGGSDVTLNATVFDGNRIGVHVFKDGQLIEGCEFRNSSVWGVKEEVGASPVMRNNLFDGNNIDYYDSNETRVTVEELNAIAGNAGNGKEGS